jgi:hypothetical protein
LAAAFLSGLLVSALARPATNIRATRRHAIFLIKIILSKQINASPQWGHRFVDQYGRIIS